jgi:diamine N-acetyltransferase
MEPEDLDLLYRIENDRSLWDVGVTNVPYSRYTLHDYIAQSSGDIYTDGQVRLIVETEDGETIGIADLMNFDAKNCRAEVGLVLECKHRRKGYGKKVLEMLADYALRVLHLHQLYAYVPNSNAPSLSLFVKSGYKKTAELTDWLFDGRQYHSVAFMQLML